MDGHQPSENRYALGHHPEELARLDRQAAAIDGPTRLLLQAASLAPGTRVLDLGTGLGHVAQIVGEIVGPAGSVLGIDWSGDAIAVARERAQKAGAGHLTFEEGDAREWRASSPFDASSADCCSFMFRTRSTLCAIICTTFVPAANSSRLTSISAQRAASRRFRSSSTRSGGSTRPFGPPARGRGSARGSEPFSSVRDSAGFDSRYPGIRAAARPVWIGASCGCRTQPGAGDRQSRIATAEEMDIATLEQRMAEAIRQADAVILPPTVVGAWGYYWQLEVLGAGVRRCVVRRASAVRGALCGRAEHGTHALTHDAPGTAPTHPGTYAPRTDSMR